jgi:superoxide reductase
MMAKLKGLVDWARKQTGDIGHEEHAPVIELPDEMQPGEKIDITVWAGREAPHPNSTEHFIAWIELFFKPDNSQTTYYLGRTDFMAHGATTKGPNTMICHTEPQTVFQVKLDQPGQLIATSCCNIHGLWDGSVELKF